MSESDTKNDDVRSKWLKYVVIGAVCVGFFVLYSVFSFLTIGRFTSPDEVSNAYWSETFRAMSKLWLVYPPAAVIGELVHPRSMRVVDGMLLPGGFIGLPVLLGGIGKIFAGAMQYVTPILGMLGAVSVGVIAWRASGRRFFGMAAAFLVLADPVWWYWSSRSFMPNIAALGLLMSSMALLVWRPFARWWTGLVLSGICAAIGFAVRPIEVVWFAIAVVIVMIGYRDRIRFAWPDVIAWAMGFLVAVVPFALFHYITFGSFASSGYGDAGSGAVSAGSGVLSWVLPFGFAPRTALVNAWNYLVVLFPVWAVVVSGSFAVVAWLFVKKALSSEIRRLFLVWIAMSVVLGAYMVLFYGSAVLSDNPRIGAVTIGVSYTRYWLPLYVLSVVPVTIAGAWVFDWLRGRIATKYVHAMVGGLCVALALGAADIVWRAPEEGLLAVMHVLDANSEKASKIFAVTPDNSFIITLRGDKFLFPKRQVIAWPLEHPATLELVAKNITLNPFYYLGFTYSDTVLEKMNADFVVRFGFLLEPKLQLDSETLYAIVKK